MKEKVRYAKIVIKLAINYSGAARGLLEAGQIEFDIWKCAPKKSLIAEIAQIRPQRPGYVHLPLDAGDPLMTSSADWESFERLLDQTGTPFVNVHLNARRETFPFSPGASVDHERAQVRDRFLHNVSALTDRFGPERVIAENVIYRGPGGEYARACVEPDLISEVIEETGCGLLLDTAHARISSDYLLWNVNDYIAALPCHRLREMHVTGVAHDGTRLRDSMSMGNDDWTTTRWVIDQIAAARWPEPWVVAMEYGGTGPKFEFRSNAEIIRVQLPMLRALLDLKSPASLRADKRVRSQNDCSSPQPVVDVKCAGHLRAD